MNATLARPRLAACGLLLLLGLASLWSLFAYWEHQAAAQLAAENLSTCQKLLAQLQQLQTDRPRASLAAHSDLELHRRLEQASTAAGFSPTSLDRIDPEPARRLSDTDYRLQSVHLSLPHITLAQLLPFLHSLSHDTPLWHLHLLRLTPPRHPSPHTQPTPEVWQAEVTLTQVIFSPKNAAPR